MEDFKRLFKEELVPAFYEGRSLDVAGLRLDWDRIPAYDASNFLRAWNAGLLIHHGSGHYSVPRSSAKERFFWEVARKITPQPVTLWVEPVVTVSTLAWLHFDFGWPLSCLGMQSENWEFDLVAFLKPDATSETIACEIKKARGELDRLVAHVRAFANGRPLPAKPSAAEKNAYKKYIGLKARHASIFWAVAPGGYEFVFHVEYGEGDTFTLAETTTEALIYKGN